MGLVNIAIYVVSGRGLEVILMACVEGYESKVLLRRLCIEGFASVEVFFIRSGDGTF